MRSSVRRAHASRFCCLWNKIRHIRIEKHAVRNAMMKAVIIEDEERSQIVLSNLLRAYCPEVEVVATAASVSSGVQVLQDNIPDVIFLDVQIAEGTGFDVLDRLPGVQSSVIFTTAYDSYALRAFEFSAIDYLLKPIDIEELQNAVRRASMLRKNSLHLYKIRNLLAHVKHPDQDPVLLVSDAEHIEAVRIRDIVRCEALGGATQLFLKDRAPVMLSKVIKDVEFLLQDYDFYRIHQAHLVNMREVKKLLRSDEWLLMLDGTRVQLARSRKDEFVKAWRRAQA